jgi:DNA-binding NtrC family response regulator
MSISLAIESPQFHLSSQSLDAAEEDSGLLSPTTRVMTRIDGYIEPFAIVNITILFLGESGVGKAASRPPTPALTARAGQETD